MPDPSALIGRPAASRAGIEVEYTAPQGVRDAIASLGRTEDLCFSPNDRRIAVAGYGRDRITVFDIEIDASAAGTQVALTGVMELSSSALNQPHGVDFVDDEALIVANREGGVTMLELPTGESEARSIDVPPIQIWPPGNASLLEWPGSVSAACIERDLCEILICNNYGHTVTRHLLEVGTGYAVKSDEVLLRKWLHIPDGVTVSADRRWIAVSNHNTHSVFIYGHVPSLDERTDPIGVLRGVSYPHGLRFSPDGRHLFVADAGTPNLRVYASDGDDWRGVRHPAATIEIMDEAAFSRGRTNPQEGGPKGLAINSGSNVLVVTSEFQPLAFFDVPALLERASAGAPPPTSNRGPARADGAVGARMDERSERERRALQVSRELNVMAQIDVWETRAREAEAAFDWMRNSLSWRMTAPLRLVRSALRRLR